MLTNVDFWIALGKETCDLNRRYHNCRDVVAAHHGPGGYADCYDIDFFMENMRDALDAELKKAFKPGSPEESVLLRKANAAAIRDIHHPSDIFYFLAVETPGARRSDMRYVEEFERDALRYFDFVRDNLGISLARYEEWYVDLMNQK